MRRAGVDAARQVGEALSQIDLSGVSRSIEKVMCDVGQQLSAFGRDQSSPYVISDSQVVSRGRWRMWAGFALLVFLALPLVIVGLGMFLFSPVSGFVTMGLGIAATIFGARLVGQGSHEKSFAQVLRRVDQVLGARQSIPVLELANETSIAVPRLSDTLDEAISRGLIPEGHLGMHDGKKVLYLTEDAWGAAQGVRRYVQPASASQTGPDGAGENSPGLSEEAREVLSAVEQSIEKIRDSASRVREAEVRATLERIASKSEGICAYVLRHSEVASQFRKAATYYLPTTAKLADSYAELEGHATGPEAVKTLSELRSSFTQIDDALARLSDELVFDQSIDVHSDIEVLRTVLKQDGLSE